MILAIDATNWIHTLWHTVGNQAPTLAATRLQAAVNYISTKTNEPTQAFACWDRPSFRSTLYPEYKANRKEKDPGLQKALDDAQNALSQYALSIAIDGLEADDLLASIATTCNHKEQRCILASTDKDLYQCLRNGTVSILRNFRTSRLNKYGIDDTQLTDPQWMTQSTFTDEYGLRPDQWPDYQALCGQPGDNIQGCPGIGPKTAAAMLQKCGSLPELLKNPWNAPCSNRQRNTLFAWKPKAELALRLVTLVKTADVLGNGRKSLIDP